MDVRTPAQIAFFPQDQNDQWRKKTQLHFPEIYANYGFPMACDHWEKRFKDISDREYSDLPPQVCQILIYVKEGNLAALQKLNLTFSLIENCQDKDKKGLMYWARVNKRKEVLDYLYKIYTTEVLDPVTRTFIPGKFHEKNVLIPMLCRQSSDEIKQMHAVTLPLLKTISPLQYIEAQFQAAIQDGEIATIQSLLQAYSLTNIPNLWVGEAFVKAIILGHDDLALYLLDQPDWNINEIVQGYSPLHFAAHHGKYTLLLNLLKRGAIFTLTDVDNKTAGEVAKLNSIQNILWFLSHLQSKANHAPIPADLKTTFICLGYSFELPISKKSAYDALMQVILDSAPIETLDTFTNIYTNNAELQQVINNIPRQQSIQSHPTFLVRNQALLLDAIQHMMYLIGKKTYNSQYDSRGTQGPGLYLSFEFLPNIQVPIFYLEAEYSNVPNLINEIATDIGFLYLMNQYSIDKMLIHPTGDTSISYTKNILLGYSGLNAVWNPENLEFNWDKFKLFVTEKIKDLPAAQLEKLLPVIKQGVEVLPLLFNAQYLREKLLSQESELVPQSVRRC